MYGLLMNRKCVTGCKVHLPLQPKDMSDLKDAQLCVAMQLFGLIVKLIFGDRVRVQFPRVYWNGNIISVTKPLDHFNDKTYVPSNRFSSKSNTRNFLKFPIVVGIFLNKLFDKIKISSCCRFCMSSGSFVIEFVPKFSSTIFVHVPRSSGNCV